MHKLYSLIGFDQKTSAYIAIAGALGILIIGVYKIRITSKSIISDAENGWVLLYTPEGEDKDIESNNLSSQPTEFLMYSNLVWTIDDKPAGWRHKNKNRT